MTTRRTVLATGAVLLAAPAAGAGATPPIRFDAVVFDGRFAESRRFARAMRASGARAFDVGDDIGRAWFGALGEIVRQGPARIAGLTAHTDLFISRSLAAEHGLRQRYEGRHDGRGADQLVHDLGCPAVAGALSACGVDWSAALAETLLRGGGEGVAEAARVEGPRPAGAAATLFSWVLA